MCFDFFHLEVILSNLPLYYWSFYHLIFDLLNIFCTVVFIFQKINEFWS